MPPYLVAVCLLLVGLGAGFVQRVSGFGLGIFAMIFLPSFLPSVAHAATVSCLFSCGTSTYNALKYRKSISLKTAIPMLFSALLAIPFAVYLASSLAQECFKMAIGILFILLSLFLLFFHSRVKIKPTITNGILSGAISGFLNGLVSTGGPPAVVYLSNALTDKLAYFATIQFYFCVTNLYATANRAVSGLLTVQILAYAAIGFAGCMLGDFAGKRVFDHLDGEKLKKVVCVGMIISGVVMIV